MNDEAAIIAIICSTADLASLNILQHLQKLASWERCGDYDSSGLFRLIVHSKRQITLRGLDGQLAAMGLHPKLVVFASRHKSESGKPWIGGHFTGEKVDERLELSTAAPSGLRSFLRNISAAAPVGFDISAEATHHGPTDLTTPSFFAEIGSSEPQWQDPQAGEAVARAILGIELYDLPVFLGFGGGHYVPRQTSLMFEADISFGHLFSSYQLGNLDRDMIIDAQRKSEAEYAYIDRKSMRSGERGWISGMLDSIGIPVLRGKEIRTKFPAAKKDMPVDISK
ncbi:MAG: D-aminoacyl-tRNA deacylase [Methanotrichaceae archaeon]